MLTLSYYFRLTDSRQRDSFPELKQLSFVAMNCEGANHDDDSRAFDVESELAASKETVERLQLLVKEDGKRARFGKRSEKFDPDQ